MKLAVVALALTSVAAAPAPAADRLGESCSGTETLQVGTQAPKTVPYSLTFSADLAAGFYCYGKCGPDQTYRIANVASDRIKLADFDLGDETVGSQKRHLTFAVQSRTLTDFEVTNLGVMGKVVRNAAAQCRAAPFHEPTPPRHS